MSKFTESVAKEATLAWWETQSLEGQVLNYQFFMSAIKTRAWMRFADNKSKSVKSAVVPQ